LAKAQSAMQGSPTNKTTYLRAGTYALPATLILTKADDGVTLSFYPPDGYDTAVLDGGGQNAITIQGGSGIIIDGLEIKNVDMWGIGAVGGNLSGVSEPQWSVSVGPASGNTIANNIIHDIKNTMDGNVAGISFIGNIPHTTIANNVIYASALRGISLLAENGTDNADSDITGSKIEDNVTYDTALAQSDVGAIHVDDRHGLSTGSYSTSLAITHNFVRDYGDPSRNLSANDNDNARGIYLDDGASNFVVSGNIVTGGGTQAFLVHSGMNNTIEGNIVDVGSTGTIAVMLYSGSELGTSPMTGNVFENNIILSGYAGQDKACWSGKAGLCGSYVSAASPPAPPTIAGNVYWNFAGGTPDTSGNGVGDNGPRVESPQISGWTYNVATASPVFQPPVRFLPIVGNWGPPGYVIPPTGTAPSCPH
jgi:hypothetical protein